MRPPIDLHLRYSLVHQKPEIWAPIVQIGLRHGKKSFGAMGLLDTGSSWTIIGTKYADPLRMDWRNAEQMTFIGFGNAKNVGHKMRLTLVLSACKYVWEADVLVSEAGNPFPFILLGHQGFFENFDVTFQTRRRYLRIQKD